MTRRSRPRPFASTIILLARDAARNGRGRLFAGAVAAATVVGGTSAGFALNQDEPSGSVGLAGLLPEFPPEPLSSESFARLDENWAKWSEDAADDVAALYSADDTTIEQQRELIARLQKRVRTLRAAILDPAYKSIRPELTGIYGPLSRRVALAEAGLDMLTGNAPASAGPARDAAANTLRNALTSLEVDLRNVPKGSPWLRYLHVDEVRSALSMPNAPTDPIEKLVERLDPEEATEEQAAFLERPSFEKLGRAARSYLAVRRRAEQGPDRAAMREQLSELFAAIDEHEVSPTTETAARVRDARRALRDLGGPLAEPVEEVLLTHFFNYNARFVADETFLAKLVNVSDIDCGPVCEQAMGAVVRGQQTTRTTVNLNLIPSEEVARFEFALSGVSNSRTNATTRQATVASVGTHNFYATKPIVFDGERFAAAPADLSVNPNIRHVGIRTKYDNIFFGLFRKAIQRRGMREANSRLPQSRAHTAQRMRERVLPEFDRQVDENFGEINAELAGPTGFRGRAERLGVAPTSDHARTTSDRFFYDALIRGDEELAGSPPNYGSTRGVGFTLQVHESLLNNAADRWNFAGRTMTDAEVEAELERWFGDLLGRQVRLGEDDAAANDREPTVLIFAEEDPITFRVVNGGVTMILRAGLKQEDREDIPPQIVEVPFAISLEGDSIRFERGTVRVSPLGPPGNRFQQIARAGVMRERIEQNLTGGTRDRTMLVEREGQSPVTVRVERIEAEAGWLTIFGI